MTSIVSFTGCFHFLSNFHTSPIFLSYIEYPTVEHAYQAAKTIDADVRLKIKEIKYPGMVKRFGKNIMLRPNWEELKLPIMENLLRQKFLIPYLGKLLVATQDFELIEGNYWGDTFWGQCPVGNGQNNLGKLLMKIRNDLCKIEK